ncbi:MAG: PC4/YdbC family ssDNA-binding protein [Spirochaetes bacterium]|nr:PC4/YdbC family ssDNA-binding protein [Spirochaetota bacterium]
MEDKGIRFEIKQQLAVLGEGGRGWKTELNLVSWNDREPKLDIRAWDPGHLRMGKGVTLTRDEAAKLVEALGPFLREPS